MFETTKISAAGNSVEVLLLLINEKKLSYHINTNGKNTTGNTKTKHCTTQIQLHTKANMK